MTYKEKLVKLAESATEAEAGHVLKLLCEQAPHLYYIVFPDEQTWLRAPSEKGAKQEPLLAIAVPGR